MPNTVLLDVEAATELHRAMNAVAEELDGDRAAIRVISRFGNLSMSATRSAQRA